MVVQVDNPANSNMHYGDNPPVKTLATPNYLPKKHLYSDFEANRIYKEMSQDLYESQNKSKPLKTIKFPAVLKILLGGIGITTAILFRKDIAKLFKNFFK